MIGRKRILTIIAAVFLTATIAVTAQMHRGMGGPGPGPHGMQMRDCFDDLNLTPEQENKIIDQRFAHKQEVLPIQKDLLKKKIELKAELDKDVPDQAKLDRISDELAALQGKLKKAQLHFLLSIKSILTKEQWQEAKENFLERRVGGPGMNRPAMEMQPGRGPCKMPGGPGMPGNAPAPPPPLEDED